MKKRVLVCSILLFQIVIINSCHKGENVFISYEYKSFNNTSFKNCEIIQSIFQTQKDPVLKHNKFSDVRIRPSLWDTASCTGLIDIVYASEDLFKIYPFYIGSNNVIYQLFDHEEIVDSTITDAEEVLRKMKIEEKTYVEFIRQRIHVGVIYLYSTRSMYNNVTEFEHLSSYYLGDLDW